VRFATASAKAPPRARLAHPRAFHARARVGLRPPPRGLASHVPPVQGAPAAEAAPGTVTVRDEGKASEMTADTGASPVQSAPAAASGGLPVSSPAPTISPHCGIGSGNYHRPRRANRLCNAGGGGSSRDHPNPGSAVPPIHRLAPSPRRTYGAAAGPLTVTAGTVREGTQAGEAAPTSLKPTTEQAGAAEPGGNPGSSPATLFLLLRAGRGLASPEAHGQGAFAGTETGTAGTASAGEAGTLRRKRALPAPQDPLRAAIATEPGASPGPIPEILQAGSPSLGEDPRILPHHFGGIVDIHDARRHVPAR